MAPEVCDITVRSPRALALVGWKNSKVLPNVGDRFPELPRGTDSQLPTGTTCPIIHLFQLHSLLFHFLAPMLVFSSETQLPNWQGRLQIDVEGPLTENYYEFCDDELNQAQGPSEQRPCIAVPVVSL